MEGIEQVIFKLSLRQPETLRGFEHLCERGVLLEQYKVKLQGICDRARAEQLLIIFGVPFATVCLCSPSPAPIRSDFTLFFLLQSINSCLNH